MKKSDFTPSEPWQCRLVSEVLKLDKSCDDLLKYIQEHPLSKKSSELEIKHNGYLHDQLSFMQEYKIILIKRAELFGFYHGG